MFYISGAMRFRKSALAKLIAPLARKTVHEWCKAIKLNNL